jgi:hypothetical protein
MRRKFIWILFIAASAVPGLSCKKFLNVMSSNEVLQEDLFKDGDGFHIAVNGVYRTLSSTQLYGKNLSWGLISALGYNYDNNYEMPTDMAEGTNFEWTDPEIMGTMDQVWSTAYNAIANCNNIIQETEKKDTSFFAQKTYEKNMILGEMYGVRAMLHFDMLRLFAPAPVSGGGAAATIPYVTVYPTYQPEHLPMQAVFADITRDMNMAKTLLAPVDTVWLKSNLSSFTGRVHNPSSWIPLPQGDFFNYRAERMNYAAATALLARIYMYKGDYDSAYANAAQAYYLHTKGWYPWTSSLYQGQITDVDYIYTKRPEELFLCFSNNRNYDNYDTVTVINRQDNLTLRMNDDYMQQLFEGDLDDYRIVGWYNRYGDQHYLTWQRPKGTSYNAQQTVIVQGPLLPVIRFSEMYHVMIECDIRKGDLGDARTLFNDLRINRGAKTGLPASMNATDMMLKLRNDIIRETLTEGQTFFMFKRLGVNIFNGATDRVMGASDWYSPLPLSETDYQY